MSSAELETCNVCCSEKAYFIKCHYCNEKACRSCYQTYILNETQDKCMFCSKTWTIEFIQSNFKSSFINNKYKLHKQTIMFEREKALLPQTQLEIEEDKKKEKIREQVALLREEQRKIERQIHLLTSSLDNKEEKKEEKKIVNIIPCSKNNCRGFLNDQSICGICETKHCKKCRIEVPQDDDEHKCNPDTLETIKMLEKETKPCPKCYTRISKISGCDQMWCTQCKTAFSWTRGTVENGVIHNPHYWQYLNAQGRDLEEVNRVHGGGQQPRQNECLTIQDMAQRIEDSRVRELCRKLLHISAYEMPKFRTTTYIERNRDIRKQYLLGVIDDKKFKRTLHMREKKELYKDEILQILDMLINVARDVTLKFYNDYIANYRNKNKSKTESDSIVKYSKELTKIANYSKDEITKVCERYEYVFPSSVDFSLLGILVDCRTLK
jgi:hypothetical protein